MVERHLEEWDLSQLDFLFIENVGNLVCTADYDLGENFRVVMLATTEGEDKPSKYPPLFRSGDAFVITKMDLAGAVEFDCRAAHRNLNQMRPEAAIYETSARTGSGMGEWLEALIELRRAHFPA